MPGCSLPLGSLTVLRILDAASMLSYSKPTFDLLVLPFWSILSQDFKRLFV